MKKYHVCLEAKARKITQEVFPDGFKPEAVFSGVGQGETEIDAAIDFASDLYLRPIFDRYVESVRLIQIYPIRDEPGDVASTEASK